MSQQLLGRGFTQSEVAQFCADLFNFGQVEGFSVAITHCQELGRTFHREKLYCIALIFPTPDRLADFVSKRFCPQSILALRDWTRRFQIPAEPAELPGFSQS